MRKLKVHVLFEHGINLRPHASASLRLIRPLSYPPLRERVAVTFGHRLWGEMPDLVMVDRHWRPDIQPEMVKVLADDVRWRGAKLIYWLDDNFFYLNNNTSNARMESFQAFLQYCDGLVVSTPELQTYFSNTTNLIFLPSALDERLIMRNPSTRKDPNKIIIGYMGTPTHDEDLRLILPAFERIHAQYPGRIALQVVGALNQEKIRQWDALKKLPIEILEPLVFESEYQLFLLWFTGTVHWDFALAPLVDNAFNRYKSDIKFLDYTAAGAPGIFSRVPSYSATVKSDETGILVDNVDDDWYAAMDRMVNDTEARTRLLWNARDYLYQQRTLANCWPNWLNTLETAVHWRH
jgi:processive 1,2-diacylglycerol beta-glucosyltransferase